MSRIHPCFQLVEQFSVVTSVEPPFALLQKQVEALFRDAVEASQMPLRLVPEVLDPIDLVALVTGAKRPHENQSEIVGWGLKQSALLGSPHSLAIRS